MSPVHGIEHLNGDQHRQSHGHGMRVSENMAVNSLEFLSFTNASKMVSLQGMYQ
jgi:hypothetical protein